MLLLCGLPQGLSWSLLLVFLETLGVNLLAALDYHHMRQNGKLCKKQNYNDRGKWKSRQKYNHTYFSCWLCTIFHGHSFRQSIRHDVLVILLGLAKHRVVEEVLAHLDTFSCYIYAFSRWSNVNRIFAMRNEWKHPPPALNILYSASI